MSCPCGSTQPIETCCGPLLGGKPAPTALALMRSRYTAFVQGKVDYILDTHDPQTRNSVDRTGTQRWAEESNWKGLQIVGTQDGGASDKTGTVEFIARYEVKGQSLAHHEMAQFRTIDGRWFFVEGRPVKGTPARADAKPERNAPCPCGSGKKYKKCHGGV